MAHYTFIKNPGGDSDDSHTLRKHLDDVLMHLDLEMHFKGGYENAELPARMHSENPLKKFNLPTGTEGGIKDYEKLKDFMQEYANFRLSVAPHGAAARKEERQLMEQKVDVLKEALGDTKGVELTKTLCAIVDHQIQMHSSQTIAKA